MSQAFLSRVPRIGLAVLGAVALLGLSGSGSRTSASDRGWPTEVAAVYKIAFNGFDIGRFTFTSYTGSGSYRLDGNAQISALLGAFKWQGVSQAKGNVSGDLAAPGAYGFDYNSSAKSGSIRLGFHAGDVTSMSATPPTPPDEDLVPVESRHLAGVLDPLTAVLSLTRAGAGEPCRQRLPIFDGKQRFDLVFSPKGDRRIAERRPSGQPGIVHVCGVRYQPIAGYKRGSEQEEAARKMDIEITLRPVPSANLLVPHQITIPALVGTAVLTLQRIDIRTPGSDQIALVN
jgi:hypothetical protein